MKHRVQIRLWYGVFLSVFTAVLGVVLIAEAAQVYYGDPNGIPYSRALVGERLFPLIAPFVLYVLAVIGGFVLAILFPLPKDKEKVGKEIVYRRLRGKLPEGSSAAYQTVRAELRRYETRRYVLWGVCAGFALSAAAVTVWYLADIGHFAGEITESVLQMLRLCLPMIGCTFLLFLAAALYEGLTLGKRLDCLKVLLALGKGNPPEAHVGVQLAAERALGVLRSDVALWVIRGAVLVLGVVFLAVGIVNGGANDVYLKAIKICTECIGLG